MSETTRLLKGIMKTSGWTQEQVAEKLGVSFQTMNAWVNGRTKPRTLMRDRIRKLYLAQDITRDTEPTYVTILDEVNTLKVGDDLLFKKSDAEVNVYRLGLDADGMIQRLNLRIANPSDSIVKGTSALEQICDRFNKTARVKVSFMYKGIAIARVVEWDYAEKGE